MNSLLDSQLIVLIGVFTLMGAIHTLARHSFIVLAKNFDPLRDDSFPLPQVHKLVGLKFFHETLAFGRIFNIVLSSLYVEQLFQRLFINIPLSYVLSLFLTVIFVYSTTIFVPRSLAMAKAYSLAKLIYWTYYPLWVINSGVGRVLNSIQEMLLSKMGYDPTFAFLTDDEKQKMEAEESPTPDALEDDEKAMIRNIIEFGDRKVDEVMTPRPDMITLSNQATLNDVKQLFNTERITRVPVYSDTIDNIIGILQVKDFLQWLTEHSEEQFVLDKLLRAPYLVDGKAKIDDVMRELRFNRNHLAIVIDEYGGTDGLVTLEDILEEIVGDIYDEDDEQDGRIQQIQTNAWIVEPSVSIEDFMESIQYSFKVSDEYEVETLAGLIISQSGHQPRRGQQIELYGLNVKILKMSKQRIERILIEKPITID